MRLRLTDVESVSTYEGVLCPASHIPVANSLCVRIRLLPLLAIHLPHRELFSYRGYHLIYAPSYAYICHIHPDL